MSCPVYGSAMRKWNNTVHKEDTQKQQCQHHVLATLKRENIRHVFCTWKKGTGNSGLDSFFLLQQERRKEARYTYQIISRTCFQKKTISCPYITREKFYKIEKKHNERIGNKKEIGTIFKEKKKQALPKKMHATHI